MVWKCVMPNKKKEMHNKLAHKAVTVSFTKIFLLVYKDIFLQNISWLFYPLSFQQFVVSYYLAYY